MEKILPTLLLAALCGAAVPAAAPAQGQTQPEKEPMAEGPYEPTWESLAKYEVPEWFKDAKFGIWAHWGPQCQPEAGDWYARSMYYPGSWANKYHVEHYGDPAEFGFKDVINEWKARNWEPDSLIRLYKEVGARYFMTLANHHDNLDLWDSPYQPWNSCNMGPKRNIVGEWAEACKKYGLPLGVSIHASHAWTWYEGSQDYDGKLTREDGKGRWWEGYDPQDLYAQNHPRSQGSENEGTIHSQWEWGNGAAQPSAEFQANVYNRTVDLINRYDPAVIYFDDTAVPFYPISDVGMQIVAHYYNHDLQKHKKAQVVATGKKLNEEQKGCMLWDVERGIPDRPQPEYWQTCTCLGNWHYDRGLYERDGYKSAATVVKMLIDIVSKNGNLLLSVPLRGDGNPDEKELKILQDLKKWMDDHKESIYDTRPWKVFGEGPTAEEARPLNAQGFNEGVNYTAADVRYVEKKGTVYASLLGWPENRSVTLKALATGSGNYAGKVKKVKLLGGGELPFSCDGAGLHVELPASPTNDILPVMEITFSKL